MSAFEYFISRHTLHITSRPRDRMSLTSVHRIPTRRDGGAGGGFSTPPPTNLKKKKRKKVPIGTNKFSFEIQILHTVANCETNILGQTITNYVTNYGGGGEEGGVKLPPKHPAKENCQKRNSCKQFTIQKKFLQAN